MATKHTFLRGQYNDEDDPVDSVLYGPSTQNKIERWWRELLDRMERFFKSQLSSPVESGDYDPSDQTDRYNLDLVMSKHKQYSYVLGLQNFCFVDNSACSSESVWL